MKSTWTYDRHTRRWTRKSTGTGVFFVEKGARLWYAAKQPWTGNPVILSSHADKASAMRAAEALA